MTFDEAKALHDHQAAECRRLGAAWNAIPGAGTGPMGMTPDAVKSSPAYRAAKAAYDAAFQRLRNYNRVYSRAFKKEIALDRDSRRRARMVAT